MSAFVGGNDGNYDIDTNNIIAMLLNSVQDDVATTGGNSVPQGRCLCLIDWREEAGHALKGFLCETYFIW